MISFHVIFNSSTVHNAAICCNVQCSALARSKLRVSSRLLLSEFRQHSSSSVNIIT
jgi:hypothetical protein